MFGFGLAFAIPFTHVCLCPSLMDAEVGQSQADWLNSVKVVLGFIMLAFSLKFAFYNRYRHITSESLQGYLPGNLDRAVRAAWHLSDG
jgi:hypothetical protein